MEACYYGEATYDAVRARLSSLRHLRMCSCNVPQCISGLTGLESLHIGQVEGATGEDHAHVLRVAVWPQMQLTFLVLENVYTRDGSAMHSAHVSAVQGLRQLRQFHFVPKGSRIFDAHLPGGPWMGGLRSLATQVSVLAGSLPSLAGATQLEKLEVYGFGVADAATCRALLQWAGGSAAPLRRLSVGRVPASAVGAAHAAMHAKPALQICEFACGPDPAVPARYYWDSCDEIPGLTERDRMLLLLVLLPLLPLLLLLELLRQSH